MWLFDSLQIVLGKNEEDQKKETSFVLLSTLWNNTNDAILKPTSE